MRADDPRHGQERGYVAGCRDACCRQAAADEARRRRARQYLQGPLLVPALGTHRRIRALMALGWSTRILDDRLGQKRGWTIATLDTETVLRRTAEKVADLYEQLSMQLPPQNTHRERQIASRSRNYARRMGWAPPLAWDDIDDENERPARPTTRANARRKADIDEVVVARVLAGERLTTTRAEKDEVVRRWKARGYPLAELERVTGWKVERYGQEDAA